MNSSDDTRTYETLALEDWGWNPSFLAAMGGDSGGLEPARVLESNRERFTLIVASGSGTAEAAGEPSGSLRNRCVTSSELPAVGDWVLVRKPEYDGPRLVDRVLPRFSAFTRKYAGLKDGDSDTDQVLAANVDLACIVCAAGNDWNPRRIERYLTLAWNSGAKPVLAVTKADLCADRAALESEAALSAPGVGVHLTCALEGDGVEALAAEFSKARTAVFLGSSGAGKSTLINAIAGARVARTGEVKAYDQRGRHTTTARSLYRLPSGALAIDTPGLREVQLNAGEDALDDAFPEIAELAARCRFRDCGHSGEPGCAVKEALASGELSDARYRGWLKLQREIVFFAKDTDRKAKAIFDERVRRMMVAQRRFRKDEKEKARRFR